MVSLTPEVAPPPAALPPLSPLKPLSPPPQAAASMRPTPATSARGARVRRIIVDLSSLGGLDSARGTPPRSPLSRTTSAGSSSTGSAPCGCRAGAPAAARSPARRRPPAAAGRWSAPAARPSQWLSSNPVTATRPPGRGRGRPRARSAPSAITSLTQATAVGGWARSSSRSVSAAPERHPVLGPADQARRQPVPCGGPDPAGVAVVADAAALGPARRTRCAGGPGRQVVHDRLRPGRAVDVDPGVPALALAPRPAERDERGAAGGQPIGAGVDVVGAGDDVARRRPCGAAGRP